MDLVSVTSLIDVMGNLCSMQKLSIRILPEASDGLYRALSWKGKGNIAALKRGVHAVTSRNATRSMRCWPLNNSFTT